MTAEPAAGEDAGPPATIRDLIGLTRDRDEPALVAPERATDYSAADFATGVWKAGNLLTHYGAGAGRCVAVAIGPKEPGPDDERGILGTAADPLLAILGALVVGAPVELGPSETVDAQVVVAPAAWLERITVSPRTSVIAYGGPPEDPTVSHFERQRWSENPTEPPEAVPPTTRAFERAARPVSQAGVLSSARELVDEYDISEADTVRVEAPVDRVPTFVAGVIAPLVAGIPIRPIPASAARGEKSGIVVSAGSTDRVIDAETIR